MSVVSKARDKRLQRIESEQLRIKEQEIQRQLAFEKLSWLARKLRIALLLALSFSVVATYGGYIARVGGDERAILQLLAIHQSTPSEVVDSAILTVLAKNNATQKLWKTGERITSVAMNHQGRHIISAGMGNTLQLWNLQGQLISMQSDVHQCRPDGNAVRDCGITKVVFSPDDLKIASASQDRPCACGMRKLLNRWVIRLSDMKTLSGMSHSVRMVCVLFPAAMT